MVENIAKCPSERGQTAKVRSSEGCEGMEFPWRWINGTIFTNLDVIWGMSVQVGVGRYYLFPVVSEDSWCSEYGERD